PDGRRPGRRTGWPCRPATRCLSKARPAHSCERSFGERLGSAVALRYGAGAAPAFARTARSGLDVRPGRCSANEGYAGALGGRSQARVLSRQGDSLTGGQLQIGRIVGRKAMSPSDQKDRTEGTISGSLLHHDRQRKEQLRKMRGSGFGQPMAAFSDQQGICHLERPYGRHPSVSLMKPIEYRVRISASFVLEAPRHDDRVIDDEGQLPAALFDQLSNGGPFQADTAACLAQRGNDLCDLRPMVGGWRDQPRDGTTVLGDRDADAGGHLLQQPWEMRLGLVGADRQGSSSCLRHFDQSKTSLTSHDCQLARQGVASIAVILPLLRIASCSAAWCAFSSDAAASGSSWAASP